MIVFSSLQIRRGIRVLLDNATATVNPVRRSARWVKRLRQIHAAVAAEGRDRGGRRQLHLPGNWALARVNQRHRRWTCRQSSMLSTATASFANSKPNCRRPTIATTATPSPPCTASWTPSTPGPSAPAPPACCTGSASPTNSCKARCATSPAAGACASTGAGAGVPFRPAAARRTDQPPDLDAVIWLERWLKSYPGTLVLISHDRDFLDPIVDKILHIEQQTMNEYTGNYSSFERQRATKLAQQQSLYQHQQEKWRTCKVISTVFGQRPPRPSRRRAASRCWSAWS